MSCPTQNRSSKAASCSWMGYTLAEGGGAVSRGLRAAPSHVSSFCPYLSFTLYFRWSPDSASSTAESVAHRIKCSETTLPFTRSMFSCSCSHLHLWPFTRVSTIYFVFLFLTDDSLPLFFSPTPLFMCLSMQCFLNQTICTLLCSPLGPDWPSQRIKNAFSALSLSRCCLLLLTFF